MAASSTANTATETGRTGTAVFKAPATIPCGGAFARRLRSPVAFDETAAGCRVVAPPRRTVREALQRQPMRLGPAGNPLRLRLLPLALGERGAALAGLLMARGGGGRARGRRRLGRRGGRLGRRRGGRRGRFDGQGQGPPGEFEADDVFLVVADVEFPEAVRAGADERGKRGAERREDPATDAELVGLRTAADVVRRLERRRCPQRGRGRCREGGSALRRRTSRCY